VGEVFIRTLIVRTLTDNRGRIGRQKTQCWRSDGTVIEKESGVDKCWCWVVVNLVKTHDGCAHYCPDFPS